MSSRTRSCKNGSHLGDRLAGTADRTPPLSSSPRSPTPSASKSIAGGTLCRPGGFRLGISSKKTMSASGLPRQPSRRSCSSELPANPEVRLQPTAAWPYPSRNRGAAMGCPTLILSSRRIRALTRCHRPHRRVQIDPSDAPALGARFSEGIEFVDRSVGGRKRIGQNGNLESALGLPFIDTVNVEAFTMGHGGLQLIPLEPHGPSLRAPSLYFDESGNQSQVPLLNELLSVRR